MKNKDLNKDTGHEQRIDISAVYKRRKRSVKDFIQDFFPTGSLEQLKDFWNQLEQNYNVPDVFKSDVTSIVTERQPPLEIPSTTPEEQSNVNISDDTSTKQTTNKARSKKKTKKTVTKVSGSANNS